MEKVNETIDVICDWIQSKLSADGLLSEDYKNLPKMVDALADLVTANIANKYPKKFMRMAELKKMGFPEEYLLRVYRTQNQKVATKTSPLKHGSALIFDTVELEKFRIAEIKMQVTSMPKNAEVGKW
jgi:hypothetical protein|nr:MAG TPA: hypothetical protein [Caudoviricetes sp.]